MTSDYHLDSKEKDKIERLVPESQRMVFLAFRCNYKLDGKDYEDGVIALSEHFITLAKKGFMGNLSRVDDINILEITKFTVPSRDYLRFHMEDRELSIKSAEKALLRFALCLYRNYQCITSYLPEQLKFNFKAKLEDDFPEFDARLSPGQQFQFLYNAYCVYDNIPYNHYITQWVNFTSITMSGVFDLSRIPYHTVENSFASTVNLNPAFDALTYFPYMFGVVMRNVGRTDLFHVVSTLMENSDKIKIFVAEGNNIVEGADVLASSIANNPKLPLEYLDISDNPIADMVPMAEAMRSLKGKLFYLDFSNTSMSDKAMTALVESFKSNKNLWGIRYLNLGGNTCSTSVAKAYADFFYGIKQNNINVLKSLNLGCMKGGVSDVLKSLLKNQPTLEKLSLHGSKLDSSAVDDLMYFVSKSDRLNTLDVGGCGIKPEQIATLIRTISRRDPGFNLNISETKIGGKKLTPITEAFNQCSDYGWGTLTFDSCNLDANDIIKIIDSLGGCRELFGLSFNNILTHKMKNIEECLEKLFTIPDLKLLSIRGGSNKLGTLLAQYIKILPRTKLEIFDPSFNNFGEEGLDAIGDVLESSKTLQKVYIDGSGTTDAIAIVRVLDILKQCNNITIMPFPFDDIYNIMKKVSKSKSKQLYQMLSDKQFEAQGAIQRNQSACGIKTELTEIEYNPELNDLVERIIEEVQKKIGAAKPYQHSAINKIFKLPFPHMNDVDENVEIQEVPLENDGSDAYKTPELSGVVQEDNDATAISNYNSMAVGERKRSDFKLEGMNLPIYEEEQAEEREEKKSRRGHGHKGRHSKHRKHSSDSD